MARLLASLAVERLRLFLHDHRGQSMVELALTLPILVFLLIGGADVARAFAIQLAVQNGARAGAESAALDYTPTPAEARSYARQEMGRTPGLDPLAATIDPTIATASGAACPATPSITTPCYITVRVQYTFRTIIPWPLIPNVYSLDRTTSMRRFN